MVVSGETKSVPEVFSTEGAGHRKEIIKAIDQYSDQLKSQKPDHFNVRNRLRLMEMKEQVASGDSLPEIEKELWAMAIDIEEPTLRLQRSITLVIGAYTLFTLISFLVLIFTDAIILPGFNIPYTVLMMGLLGSLVSMYVRLPNLRARAPVSFDATIWFVISPPVAVIMAGIVFGMIQICLPLLDIIISDESWFFWITAWMVGFVNWVSLYDKISVRFKKALGSE